MTDGPMERILATIGQVRERRAESLRHFLPDVQVEAMTATCKACGATTAGSWQHTHGGRRIRTPTEHYAPPGLELCPGSFQVAHLTPLADPNWSGRNTPERI